jgi:hypothetical protein
MDLWTVVADSHHFDEDPEPKIARSAAAVKGERALKGKGQGRAARMADAINGRKGTITCSRWFSLLSQYLLLNFHFFDKLSCITSLVKES